VHLSAAAAAWRVSAREARKSTAFTAADSSIMNKFQILCAECASFYDTEKAAGREQIATGVQRRGGGSLAFSVRAGSRLVHLNPVYQFHPLT
jgi:hypothetical protein